MSKAHELNQSEIAMLECFKACDTDDNVTITVIEMVKYLREMKYPEKGVQRSLKKYNEYKELTHEQV